MNSETFERKCTEIKKKFASLNSQERFQTLIEMGRNLPAYPEDLKTEDRLVPGCQSILYLHVFFEDGKCYFQTDGDALISKGLAALLIILYSGESPETILTQSPTFLREIGLIDSLSPSRSNGFAQIHLRMKQEALKNFTCR